MIALRRAVVAGALLVLAACEPTPEVEMLGLTPVSFDALAGWDDDDHAAALVALLRSCERFDPQPSDSPVGPGGVAGTIADWRAPCAAARGVAGGDTAAARTYFETWFAPFGTRDRGSEEGLFTGYFEPLLTGRRYSGDGYDVPIYSRPADLVTADLGLFGSDLRGRRIAGRVEGGTLRPYDSRGEIDSGALDGRVPVIAWVDDAIDAFFLHVQGSGRIRLDDGGIVRVGYAGSNGQAYVSIGRVLVERGALKQDEVSLQTIRAWLLAHPDEAADVMSKNPSYVFFRTLDGDGPVGSQGAVLTPGRSLAVDPRYIPLGVPVWLDILAPAVDANAGDRPVRRLVVAQDTGGAIKGPIRGDLFWGFGADAESVAGRMKHQGRLYLLLPRSVAERRRAAADD